MRQSFGVCSATVMMARHNLMGAIDRGDDVAAAWRREFDDEYHRLAIEEWEKTNGVGGALHDGHVVEFRKQPPDAVASRTIEELDSTLRRGPVATPTDHGAVISQFRDATTRRGILLPADVIADGKIHNCNAEGKNGKGDARYLLHLDGVPAGGFQNWRDGLGWQNWHADAGRKFTPAERAAHRVRMEAMQRARVADDEMRHTEARERASAIWNAAEPTPDDHRYLIRKNITAHGLRIFDDDLEIAGAKCHGALLVPMRDGAELHSLQFILPDGSKLFLPGGRTKATYWSVGKLGDVLLIAEGVATAISAHEATGHATVAAFSARNLLDVAKAMHERHPSARLILCGDNDASGVGQRAATEAAQAVGGVVAIPATAGFDWNDVKREQGAEAVRAAIERAAWAASEPQPTLSRPSLQPEIEQPVERHVEQPASPGESNFNQPPERAPLDEPPVPPGSILLPNDHCTFSRSARTCYKSMASTSKYFIRGSAVAELVGGDLVLLTAAAFRSRLDRCSDHVMAFVKMDNGVLALRLKRCSSDNAEALLATTEALELLPHIRLVTRSPVIVPGERGVPEVLGPGYHPVAGGVLVTGKKMPAQVSVDEAGTALRALLVDYDFASASDESRAIAALITPALRMGCWLRDPSPVDVAEADQSQAGKTLRQRMGRAIYSENAYQVARREGGVGSVDESLSAAFVSGRPFVALDNLRGRFDSQFLESAITWGNTVSVRVPHRGEMQVNIGAVTVQLSSNGIETTRDFANRSSIVRIRKRHKNFVFHPWPEGGLLAHVEARAPYYLGCVFAIIRAWADAKQPRLDGGVHDFREWAGVLGWIVENLFGAAPLLDGHEAAQERVSNPALTWLRAVCLAAERAGRLDQELSASALAELSENEGIDLPGLRSPAAEDQAHRHVGKLLARCFHSGESSDRVEIDGFEVRKTETTERDLLNYKDRLVRRYKISRPVSKTRPVRPEPITSIENPDLPENNNLKADRADKADGKKLDDELPFQ